MAIGKIGAPATANLPRPLAPAAGRRFIEVLREPQGGGPVPTHDARAAARPQAPASPSAVEGKSATSAIRALIQGGMEAERRIDSILAQAARGKSFTPGELLAMQATVFRYSQTVELISRATDRLVGAVKQTLGTQV